MSRACYRKIDKYKYQLVNDYSVRIDVSKPEDIVTPYISLDTYGDLTIRKGYCWDGPSGPTLDTLNFMRGSLVHDALYQLLRMGKLGTEQRLEADRELRDICLEDGMSRFRAWYVYKSVRMFGASAAKPGTQKPVKVTCVPVQKKVKEEDRSDLSGLELLAWDRWDV